MPAFLKRKPVIIAACVLVAAALIGGTLFSSDAGSGKRNFPDQTFVPIDVKTATLGAPYQPESIGLSLEASELTNAQIASGNFSNYLKTLGKGTLRFAGKSADESFWTSRSETPPEWAGTTITPQDLDRASQAVKAAGWKVVIGVNFKHLDAARAADEVLFASRAFGESLDAIEIGNESDSYYTDFNRYLADYSSYVSAIRGVVPTARFWGGDFQGGTEFSTKFAQQPNNQVVALSAHAYPLSNCEGDKGTSISDLLASDTRAGQQNTAKVYAERAKAVKLPAITNEANSISCDGKAGVSDVFASALWAMDFGLLTQREGVFGPNFHGSISKCGAERPKYKYYTPLCARTKADADATRLVAQPEYYGLLALRQIPAGSFAAVENPGWAHVLAYAIKGAESTTIVLINIDNPEKFGQLPIEVTLDGSYTSAEAITLETAKHTFTAKDSITLGGQSIGADAEFTPPVYSKVEMSKNIISMKLRPGTASIIRVS